MMVYSPPTIAGHMGGRSGNIGAWCPTVCPPSDGGMALPDKLPVGRIRFPFEREKK